MKISKRNLIGIFFIAVLAVFFAVEGYLDGKEDVAGKENVANVNKAIGKTGVEEWVKNTLKLDWTTLYGGGFGYDSVIKTKKTPAVRISTKADGGWFGAEAVLSSVNLENKTLAFSFRLQDWKELQRLALIVSSDDNYENSAILNLSNFFAHPASGEWISVNIEFSYFEALEGEIDWGKVKKIAIRVVPKEGVATKVWFDNFAFLEKGKQEAVISLTFDDGFSSNVKAAKLMNDYGYIGTAFVIPEFIGTENYLTEDNLEELRGFQWEIGGHGKTDLTTLSPEETDTDLASTFSFLENRKFKGRENFAYPNGGYNEATKSQVLEYFSSARTIDGFSEPSTRIEMAKVNAFTISSSTPISEVLEVVDQAKTDGSWLILVWHDFTENPQLDIEYRMEDFEILLNYLKRSEVEVLPYGEALQKTFPKK